MLFSFHDDVYDELVKRTLAYLDAAGDVKPVDAPLLRMRLQKAKLDWLALPEREDSYVKIDLHLHEVRLILAALAPDVPSSPDAIYDRAITWARGGEAELWDDKLKLRLLLAGVKFADLLEFSNPKRKEFTEATGKLELGLVWDKF